MENDQVMRLLGLIAGIIIMTISVVAFAVILVYTN